MTLRGPFVQAPAGCVPEREIYAFRNAEDVNSAPAGERRWKSSQKQPNGKDFRSAESLFHIGFMAVKRKSTRCKEEIGT